MERPKPAGAHRRLERIAGNWVGEEKMYPSPWVPNGGTAVARVNNRLAIDGFAVVQDYEQEQNGVVNFRGHGIFTWNGPEQCYVLYWFDSMGLPPNIFKGTFENNIMILTSTSPQGHTRATFDFSQDRRYTYRMDMSQDGTKWQTFVEGGYGLKV
jgi:hypothetical protein